MKFSPTLTIFCAALTVSLSSVGFAQETNKESLKLDDKVEEVKLDPTGKLPMANKETVTPTPVVEAVDTTAAIPEVLRALSKDKLDKYDEIRSEATTYLRSVRLQEALAKLIEAETLVGAPLSEIENLRGAIYTKIKDYTTARKHFAKALTLEGEPFHPNFNLAELDFVEKKFPEAIEKFSKLLEDNRKLKAGTLAKISGAESKAAIASSFDTTEKLIQYKLLISHIRSGKQAEADKIMAGFDSFDDSCPAYYFSKAVYEFVKLDKEKENKALTEKAHSWINSAKSIYSPDKNEVYLDSIIEMGWFEDAK